MNLKMYLGEVDAQTFGMNAVCVEVIQSMEKGINSIDHFTNALLLQGKTYRTAKAYLAQTYRPLAQGIIYLCEELIRQNDTYPSGFRSQVATTDVIEQELVNQIREIKRLQSNYEQLSITNPMFNIMIAIYENMIRGIERKLDQLYNYNIASSSNYIHAIQLAGNIPQGLSQLEDGGGFTKATSTFSIVGMNLNWARAIEELNDRRNAKKLYGEYLTKHPKDIEKIITIIKFEASQLKFVDQTNDFLALLTKNDLKDTIEIKYLI